MLISQVAPIKTQNVVGTAGVKYPCLTGQAYVFHNLIVRLYAFRNDSARGNWKRDLALMVRVIDKNKFVAGNRLTRSELLDCFGGVLVDLQLTYDDFLNDRATMQATKPTAPATKDVARLIEFMVDAVQAHGSSLPIDNWGLAEELIAKIHQWK